MEKRTDSSGSTSIKRGDYVKSRRGAAEPIGVVWDIHPKNVASVEVYYPVRGKTGVPKEYEPKDLEVVSAREVPEDLVKFKGTMER
jgi:hypothetical protein